MTARQVFEATLIELSKVQAPALKLYEFNYLFNKAINQYVNKVYNTYDLNQQTTDDLRVLKATAYLTPQKWNNNNSALHNTTTNASSYLSSAHRSIQSLHGATYEVAMPIDYLHLLNCVCIYYVAKQKDCWDAGSYIEIPATRLTADSWSQIITDIYNRPSPIKPYYYIHNQNNQTNNELLPTDPITSLSATGLPNGTDMTGIYQVISNGAPITIIPNEGSSGYKYYTNIQGNWCEVSGLNISNNTIIAQDINSITATPLENKDIIKALEYNTLANAKTIMFYPDPKDTIGWAKATAGGLGESTIKYILQNVTSSDLGQGASNFQRTFKLDLNGDGTADTNISLVEKPIASRTSNVSNVRMEIRYGKDDTLFQLKEVQVDYVKSPQFIRLTQEQIDLTEDTSQIMEFPDYVNQEIINELVHLVMERVNDPRLSNNIQMTQTIARPTGQQAQSAQAR